MSECVLCVKKVSECVYKVSESVCMRSSDLSERESACAAVWCV